MLGQESIFPGLAKTETMPLPAGQLVFPCNQFVWQKVLHSLNEITTEYPI
jgi:hypothetical protein